MKKLFALLLVLCLTIGCAATAFAAAKAEITKQPETQTVKAGKSCSFQIKLKNAKYAKSITWYFVNPETGEEVSGRNLTKAVKGIKVANPNKQKITLKKVPESMHGWTVYCKVVGNGYVETSDSVLLLIEGMDVPTAATPEPAPEVISEPAPETTPEPVPEITPEPVPEIVPEPTAEPEPAEPVAEPVADPVDTSKVTITCTGCTVQANGSEEEPVASLTLASPASFYVGSDDEVQYWIINGMTLTPADSLAGFSLDGVTTDMTIVAQGYTVVEVAEIPDDPEAVATPEPVVDSSNMCMVTCTNCYFAGGGLSRAAEGSVPAGTVIRVTAGRKSDLSTGYSINGAEYTNQNEATFEYTVSGPTTIVMK